MGPALPSGDPARGQRLGGVHPVPGLYDLEIRTVICSTNAIESLNARYRRAIKARGHFPSEQAALKCRYLVTRSLDPTGTGRARWTMRWKPASTRSPSPSATDSRQLKPTDGNRRKHR
jgi:hypothetical protein